MLKLYKPTLFQLDYRQKLLADSATMAYNEPWGGTIDFSRDRWESWASRWLQSDENAFFYRYLQREDGSFVGEAAWRYEESEGCHMLSIIVESCHRRRGYGRQALRLLEQAARAAGIGAVCDHIAHGSTAIDLFLQEGYTKRKEDADGILLYKEL